MLMLCCGAFESARSQMRLFLLPSNFVSSPISVLLCMRCHACVWLFASSQLVWCNHPLNLILLVPLLMMLISAEPITARWIGGYRGK